MIIQPHLFFDISFCLKVIRGNKEAFRQEGIEPGDLGSHSVRKGACSLAAAGSTVSPLIVSICL